MNELLNATFQEYILSIDENRIEDYIMFFRNKGIGVFKVGNQFGDVHLFFNDDDKERVFVRLKKNSQTFDVRESFKINSSQLILAFSESIIDFKINALVIHHHKDINMVFQYNKGVTEKISEKSTENEKVIYEYPPVRKGRNMLTQLNFSDISKKMNALLDKRLITKSNDELCEIDCELQWLTDEWRKLDSTKKHNFN